MFSALGSLCAAAAFVLLVIYLQPQFLIDCINAFHPEVIYSFNSTSAQNRCALTIDDSPSENTESILQLLKQFNAKATFFIISENIRGREHVVKRIVKEGHEIGNHMTSDYPSLRYTPSDFKLNFLRSHATLKEFQPGMKWFRPGSGFYSSRMINTVHAYHYRLVLGSIYPHDPQIQ